MSRDMATEAADQGGVVRFMDNTLQPIAVDLSKIGQEPASLHTKRLQVFYKGEPLALGVTQLLVGIIQILLMIAYQFGDLAYGGWELSIIIGLAPFISGILYIVSGSLSIAAANNPTIRRVRGSLIANIISAVAAGIEVIVNLIFILYNLVIWAYMYTPCESVREPDKCQMSQNVLHISLGMLFMIFLFTILALCVSISIAAFGCKTICRTAYSEVSVVVYQAPPLKTTNDDAGAVLPSGENDDAGALRPSNEDNLKL